MTCVKCGAEIAEGSLYCEKCGAKVDLDLIWDAWSGGKEPAVCPHCGRNVQEDDMYCSFCGGRLEEEKAAAEPAAAGEEAVPEPEKAEEEPAAADEEPAIEPEKADEEETVGPETAEKVAGLSAESESSEKQELSEEPESLEEAELSAEAETSEDSEPSSVLEKTAARLTRFRYLAPVAAGLVFLLVLTAFLRLFTGAGPEEARQAKVIYYHDEELYLADLLTKDSPIEITDSCLDPGVPPYEGLVSEDRVSGDGNWLFWREEFDGETFDLYRMALAGDFVKEKLAANVSAYEVLADGGVLFERGGALYSCDDGGEPVRLGRNVLFWQTDPDGGLVCWMEKNGESGNVCYLQDRKAGSEKLELDKNVTAFYASDSLTRFMSLKGGVLYLLDALGGKERIAQNVVSVESYDLEEDRIYYTTENPVRLAYTDVIRDDEGAMTEEDWLYVSDLGQFEVPYRKLRYHWPEGDAEVSDRCFADGESGDPCVSESGVYCLFTEGPRIEDLKADWSEFRDRLDGGDFGTRLLNYLYENGQFSGLRLAAGGRTVNEYENALLPDGQKDACCDEEGRNLYLYMLLDGEGALYRIPLAGGNAGDLTVVDDEIRSLLSLKAADEGIYYIKDPGAYGGDLYFNGQEIAYDVFGMWMTDGWLAYSYDYDENSGGGVDFSVALYKDGEKTVTGRSVMCADCASDGTALMLTEFDPVKGEGSLLYFDGQDARVLAERATGFVPRNGSAQIQINAADREAFHGDDQN